MTEDVTRSAVLALDAATEACSSAVVVGDVELASRFEPLKRGHAERLMPMIETVMAEAGLDYSALGAIATTIGPGSFTGVRVGLATARGISLAAALPLVGVTTLEALAVAVPPEERQGHRILAALDALRGQIYAQWFDAAGLPLSLPMAAAAAQVVAASDAAAAWVVVGSGANAILDALGPARVRVVRSSAADWPEAATIGRLVSLRASLAGGIGRLAATSVQPLYLRDAGARPLEGAGMPMGMP